MTSRACGLYLLTPPSLPDLTQFRLDLASALKAGAVAALQIRLKAASDGEIAEVVRALKPVAQAQGAAVILNDRPDLAAELDCDGVHVGQEDAPYAQARRVVGADRIVGVTCHDSRHLGMEAADAGADYVAFGAFFETGTKQAKTRADPDMLAVWQETMQTPCVAIGGITVDNCGGLVRAGADFLAVSQGVWGHPSGPAAAISQFHQEIARALT